MKIKTISGFNNVISITNSHGMSRRWLYRSVRKSSDRG